MTVIDASAYVEFLTCSPAAPLRRRLANCALIHLPAVFDTEVTNVLRGLVIKRKLTTSEAHHGVRSLRNLPACRYDVLDLLEDMWRLRHNLTAYDAPYVALACQLHVPLLTADHRLVGAGNLPCQVEVF